MNPNKTCKTCIYFQKWEENRDSRFGRCHRFPPSVANNLTNLQPLVNTTDWCGEWDNPVSNNLLKD